MLITIAKINSIAFAGHITNALNDFHIMAFEDDFRALLGTIFYDELESNKNAEPFKSLLNNYIEPYIAFYVKYNTVYSYHFKVTNSGIVVTSNNDTQQIASTDIDKFLSEALKFQISFRERMVKYLIANKETFTNYGT